VVDELEEQYAEFDGLNLTFECREGILKHCSAANARNLGDLGERFLLRTQPGLEAQLANFADEIAYNNHDVDDGIRAGLITVDELAEIPLFARYHEVVRRQYPVLAGRRLVNEILRRMINHLVKAAGGGAGLLSGGVPGRELRLRRSLRRRSLRWRVLGGRSLGQ